jgi:hypothetical protein
VEEKLIKHSKIALQILIVIFTFCLMWLAFVIFPKIAKEQSRGLNFHPIPQVLASTKSFPISTPFYGISQEKSGIYHVVVEGKFMDEYLENKNAAQLALKNALSADTLCGQKIIYTSAAQLDLSQGHITTSNCK